MMARDAAYLLLESEEQANDKEEAAATKAVLEQAAAQLQNAVERVKRTVRGSVVPEHIVPNTKVGIGLGLGLGVGLEPALPHHEEGAVRDDVLRRSRGQGLGLGVRVRG